MLEEMKKQTRALALALLRSEIGVNEEGYNELRKLMFLADNCKDIINQVDATDGYFYLPHGFEEEEG